MTRARVGNLPTALIISEYSTLSARLSEELVKTKCQVKVVAKNQGLWTKRLSTEKVEVVDWQKIDEEGIDYLVFLAGGGQDLVNTRQVSRLSREVGMVIRLVREWKIKSLFVFPYVQAKVFNKHLQRLRRNIFSNKNLSGIIYVGQVIDEHNYFASKEILTKIIRDAAINNNIRLSSNQPQYFPVKAKQISKIVVKNLFSFGLAGQEVALISQPISEKKIISVIKKLNPRTKISYCKKTSRSVYPKADHTQTLPIDIDKLFQRVYADIVRKSLSVTEAENVRLVPKKDLSKKITIKKKVRKKDTKRKYSSVFYRLLFALSISVVFPLILLVICYLSLSLAKRNIINANFSTATKLFVVAQTSSEIANAPLGIFEKLPLVGGPAAGLKNNFNLLNSGARVGKRSVDLINNSAELVDTIFGRRQFKVSDDVVQLNLDLDYLYNQLGLLEVEVKQSRGLYKILNDRLWEGIDFRKQRRTIFLAKKIVTELPEMLGDGEVRTYLILVQNNTELRPTGGKITSYGLLNFSAGKLDKGDFFTAANLDQRIEGYIKPPPVVEKYLETPSWQFSDSNWHPDLFQSAQQMKWFLQTVDDQEIDGVIVIDLQFYKNVLQAIQLPEVLNDGTKISDSNLHSYLWDKSDFERELAVTELSKAVFTRLIGLSGKEKIGLAKIILENLDTKHIQVYFDNKRVQEIFSVMHWTGELPQSSCEGNCMSDWLAMVESNVGGNNLNNVIKRSFELDVGLEENTVKKELVVRLYNPESSLDDEMNVYEAYIRLLLPVKSKVGAVKIVSGDESVLVEPDIIIDSQGDFVEVGIFSRVAAGQTSKLFFSWSLEADYQLESEGEYLFNWHKQSGTNNDTALIKYHFPENIVVKSKPAFSLTGPEAYGYNTSLSRDLVSRIYWE